MRFLEQAVLQERRKLLIANWLLLALRCLLLILLGLALAQPVLGDFLWPQRRHVQLLIDNGITSAARSDNDTTRLDTLRAEAVTILDTLSDNDQLTLVPLAARAEPQTFQLKSQRGEARAALDNLTTHHTATTPARRINQLRAEPHDPGRSTIAILLSDLAEADQRWKTPTQTLENDNTHWLVRTPEPDRTHNQVRSLTLPRPVIVPERQGRVLTIPLVAELTRRHPEPPAATHTLTLTIRDGAGETLHSMTTSARFENGQQQQTLRRLLTLPTTTLLPDSLDAARLIIELTWAPDTDTLPVDNTARTTLEIRRSGITLIQHDNQPGLTAARWLALALNPDDNPDADLQRILTQNINPDALDDADLLILTAPATLSTPQANRIRDWVRRGNTALLLPPDTRTPPADWHQSLGIEQPPFNGLQTLPEDNPATLDTALGNDTILASLAAEWPTLARSVRIFTYRTITHPDARSIVNLNTTDNNHPWLAALPEGKGRWLLIATRHEPDWTSLPVKPLALPLVQTLVRDLLPARNPAAVITAGQPTDTTNWIDPDNPDADARQHAGRYHDSAANDRWLIVEPDTNAADLTAARRDTITAFLGPAADTTFVNPETWAQALDDTQPRAAAGRSVLWIALMILLSELAVARWSSTGERRWW
ncbi:hypothetical protein Pan265_27440 [Mucisphaera calidilacus]|uniref:Aerotolerance regulator N-terminal domain-containing protein n=2 Tax=Mucisphaera calidilacus TaxID=2527982 RepID=A0A518C0Y1_9BACT|nr:hypothetical protein Pan265_27440 [Mucisphaera calidilacus]